MEAIRKKSNPLPFDVMRQARTIVQDEARALENLAANFPLSFVHAVELIAECQGAVIVCGVGKAGWIGQKISASLASTSSPSSRRMIFICSRRKYSFWAFSVLARISSWIWLPSSASSRMYLPLSVDAI